MNKNYLSVVLFCAAGVLQMVCGHIMLGLTFCCVAATFLVLNIVSTQNIKKLGYEAIVEYIKKNSTLTEDQFSFTKEGDDGYASFLIKKDNKMICLGRLNYNRFIGVEYGTTKEDLSVLTEFLDLCIEKIDDDKVVVPDLCGNPT